MNVGSDWRLAKRQVDQKPWLADAYITRRTPVCVLCLRIRKVQGGRVTACPAATGVGKSELEWELEVLLGSPGRKSSGECIVTTTRDRSIRRGATSAGTCPCCNWGVERRSRLTLVVRRKTADADVSILLVPRIPASRPKGHRLRCEECIQSAYAPKIYMVLMQTRLHVHTRMYVRVRLPKRA